MKTFTFLCLESMYYPRRYEIEKANIT